MVGMNQLLANYRCVNMNDYIFVPSDVKNLYICYKDDCCYTGIAIQRRNHKQTKTYFFVSKNPIYKLEPEITGSIIFSSVSLLIFTISDTAG